MLLNLTNNKSEEFSATSLTKPQILFFSISFTFASTLAVIGNVVVIIVITFRRELRYYTNYFFLNLSITDILILVVCIPTVLQDIFLPDRWIFGPFICNFYFLFFLKRTLWTYFFQVESTFSWNIV